MYMGLLKWLKGGGKAPVGIGGRLRFINDDAEVRVSAAEEARVWYLGDANALHDYYRGQALTAQGGNILYKANNYRFFWSQELSDSLDAAKRVHSGVPAAMIDTFVNVLGTPTVRCAERQGDIDGIMEANRLLWTLNQFQIPLTLVEGWGAFKIRIDESLSDYPIIQWYEGPDVTFKSEAGILRGIAFRDRYRSGDKDYVLIDRRYVDKEGSHVTYSLFKEAKNGDLDPVPLGSIPETAGLVGYDGLLIPGYKRILGVRSVFKADPNHPDYGLSVFNGKTSLFDDLDQDLSQNSQTVRVSTPAEYYPSDLLERGPDGKPRLPSRYNRSFIKRPSAVGGDGTVDNGLIQTTQPVLNFDQYSENARFILSMILSGFLSPATLGFDMAKKDNADAQREKEKVTIMTRGNVMPMERAIISELMAICLDALDVMRGKPISQNRPEIHVSFPEYANPTFESKLKTLVPAWQMGGISTPSLVEQLWGDGLTKKEKEDEAILVEAGRQNPAFQADLLDGSNRTAFETDTSERDPTKNADAV